MTEESPRRPYQRVQSTKPGDRVLRVRTRRSRLAPIRHGVSGAVSAAVEIFTDIFTETPILPVIGALTFLVLFVPIPIFLIEQSADNAEVTSYWIGLWWAVAAFTTVGHSDIDLVTAPGRVIGSIFTIVTVGLFFGSVIAAFSSYFLLTWRKPKRQIIDTITYYLQRVDQLSVEEIEELEEITAGVLHTAKESAEEEEREKEAAGEAETKEGDSQRG